MLATLVTLALLGFAVAMLVEMIRFDGQKMLAALQGRSWTAQPPQSVRPVTVRYSQRYPASRTMPARLAWRAAA